MLQFKPLEQLMGVFPAASGNFLPETWRILMSSPVSIESRMRSRETTFLRVSYFKRSFWHRIPPSSTSILTTSPSISTARNTPGRVSQSVIQHLKVEDVSSSFISFMTNTKLFFSGWSFACYSAKQKKHISCLFQIQWKTWHPSQLYVNFPHLEFMLSTVVYFWRRGLAALCGWTSAESGAGWRLPRPHIWGRWANAAFLGFCADLIAVWHRLDWI